MNLRDAIRGLYDGDDESTIYAAKPWMPDSHALVIFEPEPGQYQEKAREMGLVYFLEVYIAQEFLEGWISNFDTEPTLEEKCNRLIQYAINDA